MRPRAPLGRRQGECGSCAASLDSSVRGGRTLGSHFDPPNPRHGRRQDAHWRLDVVLQGCRHLREPHHHGERWRLHHGSIRVPNGRAPRCTWEDFSRQGRFPFSSVAPLMRSCPPLAPSVSTSPLVGPAIAMPRRQQQPPRAPQRRHPPCRPPRLWLSASPTASPTPRPVREGEPPLFSSPPLLLCITPT